MEWAAGDKWGAVAQLPASKGTEAVLGKAVLVTRSYPQPTKPLFSTQFIPQMP